MKVEAEVKIKILDGDEQGKIDTFTTVGETDTTYTEYGILERLRLEWRYIHNVHLVEPQEKQCADCNHYGKLSLDCGRCDDDCSMFESQESEGIE